VAVVYARLEDLSFNRALTLDMIRAFPFPLDQMLALSTSLCRTGLLL
jgi:hypothetical protein